MIVIVGVIKWGGKLMTTNVQEPPSWVLQPSDLRGIEMEKVDCKECQRMDGREKR